MHEFSLDIVQVRWEVKLLLVRFAKRIKKFFHLHAEIFSKSIV